MTGSFTFKWAQPAGEVYVTGSFDNWGKSTKLDKEGDAFIATVSLPSEKILYKYVVDGNWIVDTTARREADGDGIENNVLLPEDLVQEKTEPDMSSATVSSVAPDSTTAALAAQVPKETNGDVKGAAISSVSPDSTTAALAAGVSGEARTPSLKDVPGGFPQTSAIETSDPREDAEQVPPNEPTPKHDDNSEDLSGGVKLYPNSSPEADVSEIVGDGQEKADVPPEASAVEQKKEVEGELKEEATVTPTVGGIAAAAGLSSASGESNEETTPAIAPDLVKQSQEAAHVSPEASAVESAVEAKKEFESELKQEVSPVSPVRDLAENPAASTVSPISEPAKPVAPVQLNTTDDTAASTAPVPKLEVTDPQEATTPLSPTTPVEPTKNGTPKNGSPRKSVENGNGEPPASPTQLTKKKNRFSFLGNLKEKLHFGKDKGKSKGEMSP